ncbi:hypothetical protein [Nonomuraea sp. NPDC048916]|uniref:hypothetical protein n=1 Tax=Nonomuraea sp. NPDC048916 TaxID=3154232 RepID=UPI0033FA940D
MEETVPGAEPEGKAAPETPRRRTSAIDGRLPPGVLEMLATRKDLDPEKRADQDEPAEAAPSPPPTAADS